MSEESIPEMEVPVTPPRREPGWGYVEILFVVLTFIGSLFVCAIAATIVVRAAIPGLRVDQLARNPLFFAPVQLAAYLLTFAVLRLAVVTKSDAPFWTAIYWKMPAGKSASHYVLVGVVMAMVVQVLSAYLPFPKSLPMQEYFRERQFAYMMAAFGLLVAPIAEELFFRGLAYPVLKRTMGTFAAVIVTGACFSLLHQGQLARAWAPLVVLFGVGVVLTVVRARTGSVAASWVTHVSYNGTLFATLFIYSDGFRSLPR